VKDRLSWRASYLAYSKEITVKPPVAAPVRKRKIAQPAGSAQILKRENRLRSNLLAAGVL
jgi:hypothetical protein